MKNLNEYINEGLADWGDDKLDKRMDELTSEDAIRHEIIGWLKDNVKSIIKENKLNFDFNTTPITVDYDGDIKFKEHITSLTNSIFQWGEIGGDFWCHNCTSLKTLEGAPKYVGSSFNCGVCESLKSLEGAPTKVDWGFYCFHCTSLKSLEGSPKEVGGNFWCNNCKSLKSLKGAPQTVGEDFDCHNCKSLKAIEGAPKEVGDDFFCYDCKTTFTEDDVKKVSNVKGKIYC